MYDFGRGKALSGIDIKYFGSLNTAFAEVDGFKPELYILLPLVRVIKNEY